MSEPAWVPLGAAPPSATPAGVVSAYAGAAAPSGWLLCDGTAVSRTTFAALFAAIGTAYGAGDGSTTFGLPDLRGRVAVGRGTHADVDALGDNDGSALASRSPRHYTGLAYDAGGGAVEVQVSGARTPGPAYIRDNFYQEAGTPPAPLDTPAYVVVNYIIKT